jgi:putative membrane protein
MYNYIKALHIIFVVTWFSGMFYIVRLFIYNTEAGEQPEPQRTILRNQFKIMSRRLWMGITWPSAILTLILGIWTWSQLASFPHWLAVKLIFVVLLYGYQISLHVIYRQEQNGIFKFSSSQLRIWNELATVFLFAIVFIAVVKESMSWLKGLAGLVTLAIILMIAVRVYKKLRSRRQ